jgi:1-acyl-sn-glycerol-3-phosphate acyltransferase
MQTLRNILLSPLTLLRLVGVVFISAYVVFIGWVWIKMFGFSARLQQWVMHTWGKSNIFFCGLKLKHNQLPQNDNYILMPNHRSYLDIFIVAGLTPAAMVGKAELKKWPFGRIGARVTNSILVDRKDSRSLLNTMKKIKESVTSGIPVALFPEGTTYKGPLTKTFKNGSFKIAAETGIPVIPMAIEYEDKEEAWVGADTFVGHFFRKRSKINSLVYIKYGAPIYHSDYKTLQQDTKQKIEMMLKELQAG